MRRRNHDPEQIDRAIEAAKTPKGGFDRETLARWGVAWPPPKGWRRRLRREGFPEPCRECGDAGQYWDGRCLFCLGWSKK